MTIIEPSSFKKYFDLSRIHFPIHFYTIPCFRMIHLKNKQYFLVKHFLRRQTDTSSKNTPIITMEFVASNGSVVKNKWWMVGSPSIFEDVPKGLMNDATQLNSCFSRLFSLFRGWLSIVTKPLPRSVWWSVLWSILGDVFDVQASRRFRWESVILTGQCVWWIGWVFKEEWSCDRNSSKKHFDRRKRKCLWCVLVGDVNNSL